MWHLRFERMLSARIISPLSRGGRLSWSFDKPEFAEAGQAAYGLIADLYPICRSITGNGNRETLRRLGIFIPITIHEVPSNTQVYDWTVPREWNISSAYIADSSGKRLVDFRNSNLHIMSYSVPVHREISFTELRDHLFTDPSHPDWIPYRTSYYRDTWGFCISHNDLATFREDEKYEVFIDSSLADGSLTYGEVVVPGAGSDEVLISTHICHPSMCNDNLSGVSIATILAKTLSDLRLRYSYRFLFIPGTIGSITWLAHNEDKAEMFKHGLVLSNLGDPGHCTYKKSRRGDAEIDLAATTVLRDSGPHAIFDFVPYGYDERQYCSPGFNLPVGVFSRTPHGRFPQYHTSADNLEFVQPECLADSFEKLLAIIEVLENNGTYLNLKPKCEPRLGKRNLYGDVGGVKALPDRELALLWVLNLSDGGHSLLDIAMRSGMPFADILAAAEALAQTDLLQRISPSDRGSASQI
jgi:aminopeptidase-like protein